MSANNVVYHEVNIGSFTTIQPSSSQGLTENLKHPVVYEEIPELMSRPTGWFRRFLYDYNAEIGEFFAMTVFNTVGSSNLAQILIATGWGCALILAATVAVGTSGGHLNPAITTDKAVFGYYPWKRVPGMVFAQTFGCFVGALFVWLYYTPCDLFLTVGFVRTLASARQLSLIAINPAHDFGHRLFILIAGWRDTFKVYSHYFYVPLLSPIVGGIATQGLYNYLVIPTSIKRKEDRIGYH
ncbi:hypothetical protein EC988_002353 [Linderina pennispora]|nr:hypothetical protein EC988_002353 [Linderina pennispora]